MRNSFKFIHSLNAALLCISSAAFAQTADQISDFTKAAKFDDVSEVQALIKAGVSPNTLDPKGNPMLIVAIRDKSLKVADLLLANKAIDVNLSNKSGENPLMMASIEGELSLVETLVLKNKADVNKTGWTPLHYACTTGKLSVAEFLVAKGAKVNALSQSETTPLMMAVSSGNDQLIKFLLDNGADMRMRNHEGYSAIDVAELFSKDDIREGLMSRWQKLYKQPYPGGPRKFPS
ncbi:ankyrin repeat domain-containing protein [Polynucleobacter sp. AM-25C3]|jgi:ankyrin repeat protein|uniref:ankyrin repeat domain-containing protein n=1 Tax=Polynucleobacter sp. AM-25C3 TaxID=1855569 RepID=UPI001C0CA806|nr:ankyrin repeat domain-containing protein [Polynucleobacter sp. AM-25C3]MBU3602330.1 ankyrin repeat domain-containing protein [Polynucleobacter sp. AM-25C3]